MPRRTVTAVPPWARTTPAARLLAPCPATPFSSATTRPTPSSAANVPAHPPSVPAPTTTRSAASRRPAGMTSILTPEAGGRNERVGRAAGCPSGRVARTLPARIHAKGAVHAARRVRAPPDDPRHPAGPGRRVRPCRGAARAGGRLADAGQRGPLHQHHELPCHRGR